MAAVARPAAADAIRRAPAEFVLLELLYLNKLMSWKPCMSSRPLHVLAVMQLVDLNVCEFCPDAWSPTSFTSPTCC